MRKLLFSLFIFLSFLSVAQTDSTATNQIQVTDSAMRIKQMIRDSLLTARDKAEQERIEASNRRNIESLLYIQKKNKARQKKAAIIRIGIGVGFLIILVIGLRRRRKK